MKDGQCHLKGSSIKSFALREKGLQKEKHLKLQLNSQK
jgi:hypothetical protein